MLALNTFLCYSSVYYFKDTLAASLSSSRFTLRVPDYFRVMIMMESGGFSDFLLLTKDHYQQTKSLITWGCHISSLFAARPIFPSLTRWRILLLLLLISQYKHFFGLYFFMFQNSFETSKFNIVPYDFFCKDFMIV